MHAIFPDICPDYNRARFRYLTDEDIEKYGTTNLFRVKLPGFWRMLYIAFIGDYIFVVP